MGREEREVNIALSDDGFNAVVWSGKGRTTFNGSYSTTIQIPGASLGGLV